MMKNLFFSRGSIGISKKIIVVMEIKETLYVRTILKAKSNFFFIHTIVKKPHHIDTVELS